jgi:uncharacterized protein YoxC
MGDIADISTMIAALAAMITAIIMLITYRSQKTLFNLQRQSFLAKN